MSGKTGLDKRLRALEERAFGADPLNDFPDWDPALQLEAIAYVFSWYQDFHSDGGVRYPLTDRETYILALLCSLWELGVPPPDASEHPFPSGLTIAWHEHPDGTHSASASRTVRLSDLPEDVRRHFEMMDPALQPERERFLYADCHRGRKTRGEGGR